jgi:hypothetical protein
MGATYVGAEIIGKLVDVLEMNPIEFFRRPARWLEGRADRASRDV